MNRLKIKKRIKATSIFLLILGTIILNVNWIHWNFIENNSLLEEENPNEFESDDFQMDNLRTSDYQTSFNGSGGSIDIKLHQSYLNTSFNTSLNTSDSDNNQFKLPCPTDISFNSSYTKIDIKDIYVPNRNMTIEDDPKDFRYELDSLHPKVTSFIMPSSGYLENISAYIYKTAISAGNLTVFLYNSTSDGKPDGDHQGVNLGKLEFPADDEGWHSLTGINYFLNNSKTENNLWFFGFIQDAPTDARWFYVEDPPSGDGDGVDETKSMEYTVSLTWDELVDLDTGSYTIDFMARVGVIPINNTPNPENIGMKINNKPVNGFSYINGSGYWESFEVNSSASGELQYTVSADWWDVTCNISQVQINYTKTDLTASSEFYVSGSGELAEWNVTREDGLNFFSIGFDDYEINFTIPATWINSSIEVFNGTDDRTPTIIKRLLGNGYREINIPNAGNGTYWYLTANSTNLLSSIDTYISGIPSTIANYSDIVRFNATFIEVINSGYLNLSIYNPAPNYLVYTNVIDLSLLTPDTEFTVVDWDISNDISQYGAFPIYLAWNNGTAAGLLIGNLTILGETELKFVNLPSLTFDASDIFNITAFFNDTGYTGFPPKNISDATISYRLNSNNFRTDNITALGNGLYNITIDCNDPEFSSNGPNSITVNASKQYYNNQSESIDIIILGETSLTIISPLNGASFDSSNTFNITVKYNNTIRNEIIDAPALNYSLDGGNTYRWDNIKSIGDNKYNITVKCNDTQFGNYGLQNIIINASKSYYYNQSEPLSITITGVTALTLTKWPDKSFYYSDESFIITANFKDTSRNQGLDGATIDVDVYGTPYTSPSLVYTGNGNYNITIDCSDGIFSSYGAFNIRVNASKLNYYIKSDSLFPIVIGTTSLITISPSDGSIYTTKQIFNVIIEYKDVVQSTGIPGATVVYSLNEGNNYRGDNITYIGSGRYNIEIYAGHSDFNQFGFIDLIFNASKTNYKNLSILLTIHRQITTIITPSNNASLGPVMRGLNVSYSFDYSDTLGNPINEATWERISPSYNFITYLANNGDGDYTMHFDTSYVDVSGSPYIFMFNISAIGNETQVLNITIEVNVINTNIVNLSWLSTIARHSGLNQSISFYFNDTTNNEPVLNLTTEDVIVRNNVTGNIWDTGDFNWSLNNPWNNGTYILDVSTNGLDAGWYTLEIRVSDFPNYDLSYAYVTFYLRGNYAKIGLISVTDPGGVLTPLGPINNFTFYIGSNINLEFNYTEAEFGDTIILGDADYYIVTYENLDNSSINGVLSHTFDFVYDTPSFGTHIGSLTTQNLAIGDYSIEILLVRKNYENTTFVFYAIVKDKLDINISIYNRPFDVNAGDSFTISFFIELYDGTDWIPLSNVNVELIPFIDGNPASPLFNNTNLGSYVYFEITIPNNARNITLTVNVDSTFYYKSDSLNVQGFKVIPFDAGLRLEDFMPYIIIIGAVAAVGAGSVAIYRGLVVPKKREKKRVLTEVRTIFDDAINLEHILVLYKGTGTCVYFKSFGSEAIDPELISGFISAVSSFGKEMVAQKALNEITYGDKMLLLADGEYIRVALVLSKKASIILRKHLTEFIAAFGKTYESELPNWRGQLNFFRNAGVFVDEIFNTSIILPHKITYEFSDVKSLKTSHSKDVLKIAHSCCEEAERDFFFIATLLKEATERTKKDTAEIFSGIKELRDNKILMPIEISTIEARPISQQELNLISQKVAGLISLSPEEKQKLVNDLAQMGPAEREAYFASIMERQEIVSAPMKVGVVKIENLKSAKKEIKNLKKNAALAMKENDYDKVITIYQNALMIATNWEIQKEFEELEDLIRRTKIVDFKAKMKKLEKGAKLAAKEEHYSEATQKFRMASRIASEIFKLGVTGMTKEVKRLSNKSKEYEKLI